MLTSEIWNPRLVVPFLWENGSVLVRGFKRRLRDGKPFAFSFNVADRCPIGCDCYWRAQARVKELTDEEVMDFFVEKRAEGYVHVSLIGGEPYVRPALLQKIAGVIPFGWLVTSGTTPLRHLRHTTQIISIDGATAETHDRVRKSRGLHDRIVKNLRRAREEGIGPIFLHTVLNHLNYREISGILDGWSESGLARGVLISTMTPIKGAGDDGMCLLREERVWIVEELHRLRLTLGNFMVITDEMIDRLHPDHTKLLTPEVCSTAQFIESYDAAGKRIKQCILSEKADCSECGCVVTTMSESPTKNPRREIDEMVRYFARMTSIAS